MVERVARAITLRRAEIMLGADHATQTADERELARAAISAIREPTLRMCEAGQQVNNIAPESAGLNAFEYLSRDEVAEMWRVMSDEALK